LVLEVIESLQGLELCNSLAELGLDIKWRAILYPHRVTETLVKSMKRAGCFEVALGFESGCERVLKEMNKHFVPDEVRRACKILADNGIRRIGFLLLGGPGETRRSVQESLAFADSLDPDELRTTGRRSMDTTGSNSRIQIKTMTCMYRVHQEHFLHMVCN
jgi:radical SAM superfamily enzyme YgiQ (UPF0313 family)